MLRCIPITKKYNFNYKYCCLKLTDCIMYMFSKKLQIFLKGEKRVGPKKFNKTSLDKKKTKNKKYLF